MKKNLLIIGLVLLVVMIPVILSGFSDGPKKSYKFREQAWLGVKTLDLTPQLRTFFGVAEDNGILISEIAENSPAEKQNLKAGDVIIKADGAWIKNPGDLAEIIKEFEPGETLEIVFIRDHNKQVINFELGSIKRRYHPYFGYRPGKYEVIIPEIEIPDIEIPEFDRKELENLQKDLQEELNIHREELKENLQELKERLQELKIQDEANEVI